MARIHRMDEHLTNMIAAGEVVERPMGVVKECVENSIDAQATRIEVWINAGGIEQIEIIDNGSGMDKEDALLAFERHATSKLNKVEDLWSIATLGFRGEALPSIASVAQVEMRTSDGKDATRIVVEYGETKKVEPFGCNLGTSLIIRGLFQKTPARLKHLKSFQYEAALIVDLIQKFAMSHPEIAFRLVSDGKEVFKTTGLGQLQEVLYAVYGKDVAKNSFVIEGEDYDAQITGLGVLPSISRANRNYITLFINQRMIRSFKLQKAVIDAYHRYMPDNRYPIVVLNIDLDEQLVDVNVHPSKWEIRLSKEQQLVLLIQETMRRALQQSMQAPEVQLSSPKETWYKQTEIFEEVKQTFEPKRVMMPISVEANKIEQEEKEGETQKEEKTGVQEEQAIYETKSSQEAKPTSSEKQSFPKLELLAQLHGKYILASSEEGLVILDQHAAQERAKYEYFQQVFDQEEIVMMDLLVPLSIDTTTAVMARLDEVNELFQSLHIQFEAFSQSSLIVRSLPMWLQQVDETAFLQDCLDYVRDEINLSKLNLSKDRIATWACHHSIRFNRVLTREEMQKVILDLENCNQPFHCPHGRPTMITISESQLIREFKR